MNNGKLSYKFVFIAIFIAYSISMIPVVLLKPELTRYNSVLQIFIFIIPLYIIYFFEKKDTPLLSFRTLYKINFKFSLVFFPAILWIICGLVIFDTGFKIMMQHILPRFILDIYNGSIENYWLEMSKYIKMQNWTISEFLIIASCVAILPSICEEFLFRGYLMQNIAVNNSTRYAIVMSALIFSLIHLTPVALVSLFIAGYFLGKLFFASNSIVPAIIFHFINNFVTVIAFNFSQNDKIRVEYLDFWLGVVLVGVGVVIFIVANRYLNVRTKLINAE